MLGSFIDDLDGIPGLNEFKTRGSQSTDTGEGQVEADNSSRPAKPSETFPCESCAGTGLYRGVRLHQPESKCFACGGRGWFKKSHKDRMAARAKSAARKASKKEIAQDAFKEQHPGLIEKLTTISSWNSFASEMLQKSGQWDGVTERQVAACETMIAKIAVKQTERAAVREANSGEVNVAAIEAMFQTARTSGLKKLAFTAGALKISPAKETSKNVGALYVRRDGTYQGKVLGGRFYPSHEAQPDTLTLLADIAANPGESARSYGKRTGTCCCCGRELTDPASIEAGIGPICAGNWGL